MKNLNNFTLCLFSTFVLAVVSSSCSRPSAHEPEDDSVEDQKPKSNPPKKLDAATKDVVGKLEDLSNSEFDDLETELIGILKDVKIPDVDAFLAVFNALPKGSTETGAYEMLCYRLPPKKTLAELKQLTEGLPAKPLKLALNTLFFEASDSEIPIGDAMDSISGAELEESTELIAIDQLFGAYAENEPAATMAAAKSLSDPVHKVRAVAAAAKGN